MIEHLKSQNGKSIISRIYGCFTIETDVFDSVDVIVMENRNIPKSKESDKMSFDIKGSKKGRLVEFPPEQQHWWLKNLNHKKLMKDLNYIEINRAYDK